MWRPLPPSAHDHPRPTELKGPREPPPVSVRLTRKLADVIDDIDLSPYEVGECVELPWHQAALLMAEGWAEPAPPEGDSIGIIGDRRVRTTDRRRHSPGL